MRLAALVVALGLVASACAVPVPSASARGRVEKPTTTVQEPSPSTTTTTTTPAVLAMDEQVSSTIADLEDFWGRTLPTAYFVDYEPVTVLGGYDVDRDGPPSCDGVQLEPSLARGNAFYCPPDDTVAWDEEELFGFLYDDYGPFAVSLVLAHEWGHAVQRRGSVDQTLPTVVRELQADCFAGAWAGDAMGENGTIRVGPTELDTATAGYLLFRDPTGTSARASGAHGNAFDRVGAFLDGVRNGAPACVGYAEEFPPVTQIAWRGVEDAANGGNLPAEDVFPTLSLTLDQYWGTVDEALGMEWDAFDAFDALTPGACPTAVDDEAAVAYCEATDTLLLDDVGTLQPLYDNFGDFGPAFVLGLGWAEKALRLAGADPTTATAGLRADCLVGNWAAAGAVGLPTGRTRSDGEPEVISLSPGDLDEAIQAILFLGQRQGGPADAFERVEAFRRGFFGDPADC